MRRLKAVLACAVLASFLSAAVFAQDPPKDPESGQKPTPSKESSSKGPTVEKLLEDAKAIDGFLKLHRKDETVYAEIPKSKMNKPFLMSISMARGIARGYLVSGMTRNESIYYWKLADKRLFLVNKNVRHMAKKGDPISRAVAEDFSDSIVATLTVRAKSGSSVVVDLGDLLFTDFAMVGQDLRRELGGSYSLDKRRTTWGSIKSFPQNTEIEVDATYAGSSSSDLSTIPDGRAVSITMHYSFSSIPSTGYKARPADDRIGYFLTARKNYSQEGYETPFVRYINRWKLEKANSKASLSPPKKPIVFYIEKSVPYEYRPIVREAVLEWNKAFEKAGFIDAIEVRFQEDDAAWDAEDVRYNTIRWMTGEARYAIGPSRTNPLTGEIYDADILVDSNWLRSFQRQYEYYATPLPKDGPENAETLGDYIAQLERGSAPVAYEEDALAMYRCEFTEGLAEQIALAAIAAEVDGKEPPSNGLPPEFIRQGLKELIMHEVGHTLGLRHNFKASSTIALEDLHNTKVTARTGLSGSVMDYNLVNIAPKGVKQGHWFTTTIGAWDYLAIEYGYTQVPGSMEDQKKKLDAIAERAALPANAYATDGDVGAGVDPLVNQRDMSDDILGFAKLRTQIMTDLRGQLIDKLVKDGEGYQKARSAFLYTIRDMQRAQYFAARYVGGIDVSRNHRGDKDERPALKFISGGRQREALTYLSEEVLSSGAYDFDPALIAKLGPERWDHWGIRSPSRMDLGLHDRVLSGQLRVIYQLFSSGALNRVQESSLYAANGEVPMTIGEIYDKVTDGVWSELSQDVDASQWNAANPFVSGFRRNLQRAYLKYVLLNHALSPSSSLPQDARSSAWMELTGLAKRLDGVLAKFDGGNASLDSDSEAHLRETRERIRKGLDAAFTLDTY